MNHSQQLPTFINHFHPYLRIMMVKPILSPITVSIDVWGYSLPAGNQTWQWKIPELNGGL